MDTINKLLESLPHHAAHRRNQTGRPLVTLSYAQSLDGCLTLKQGESSPVSGEGSMRNTHRLRAAHEAILVGVGTVLADNPRLTVRDMPGESPRPFVLDSQLRTPPSTALLNNSRGLTVATTDQAENSRHAELEQAGAMIWTLPADTDGRVSLTDLLVRLGTEGINSLMVEGGSQVISSFLRQGLADRVVLTIAPVFAAGYHAVHNLGFTDWLSLPRLSRIETATIDDDIIVWGDLTA